MAKKPLSFRDFLAVDYTPGEDEQVSWNAKKRHRGTVGEALSVQARRALGRAIRKNKAKIAMGKRRAAMKVASQDKLKQRAKKQALNFFFKKLSKGQSRTDVSPARRAEIEKRLSKMTTKINKYALKILPKVRQQERERKAAQQTDEK